MFQALLVGGPPSLLSHVLVAARLVDPDAAVTCAASVGGARAAMAATSGFDLVVLDLSVADADAAVLLVDLHSVAPGRPIVALPVSRSRADALCAFDLGAVGVLAPEPDLEAVADALRAVLAGQVHLPVSLLRPERAATAPAAAPAAAPFAFERREHGPPLTTPVLATLGLTPRQTDVLSLLLQGHPNKAIARELNLSVETIKDHVAAVLRSLNVTSRTQAVLAVTRILRERAAGSSSATPTLESAWRRERTSAGL